LYCPECAHRNPDENRYCGMCGERLPDRAHREKTTREEFGHREKWVEAPPRPQANPVPPVTRGAESPLRSEDVREAHVERRGTWHNEPRAGDPAPSFLGLGNAEYEKPEREISWRFWALMLLLLGVVALFGMQWRAGKLRANQPEPAKPAAIQPAEEPAVRNEPPAADQDQAQPAAATEPDKAAKPATDENAAPQEPEPAAQPNDPKSKGKGSQAAPEQPKSDTGTAEPDQPKEEEQRPETRAAATPREFSDAVVKQADSFIAAGQCNDALRALRGAGDNPKAMTKMGAMYLTGTCVEPDRVTAYAWFSQAFSADPHNLRLESTRRSIWSQMTDDERARVEAGYKAR